MKYTSNLISSKIDKELANKITANSWGKMFSTTLYISNSGNDGTADGSQEKPFSNLNALLIYIKNNFKLASNNQITIKFLSDYTFNGDLYFFELSGINANTRLIIDGEGFNVVFKARLYICGCCVDLKNLTFETMKAKQDGIVVAVDHSNLYLRENINFNLKHSGSNVFLISRHSMLHNQANISVNADEGITCRSFLRYFDFSKVDLFNKSSATITLNNINFTFAVMDGSRYAHLSNSKQIQGTATGKKYYLDSTASIGAYGHGEDYLIGSEAGYANTETNCWVI